MAQRKSWSPEEDQILLKLRRERGVRKWCQIAEIMRTQFEVMGRNGKQCRERFHNHLDSRISKTDWTAEEDQQLVSMHNGWGNKWAHIARQLSGRTDNCVKNRFYTKLRRSLRLLNDCIKTFWRKQLKPLRQTIGSKLVEYTVDKGSKSCKGKEEAYQKCSDLKSRLLVLSQESVEKISEMHREIQIRQLIEQIIQFNRKFRRRAAKKMKKVKAQLSQNDEEEKILPHEDDSSSINSQSFKKLSKLVKNEDNSSGFADFNMKPEVKKEQQNQGCLCKIQESLLECPHRLEDIGSHDATVTAIRHHISQGLNASMAMPELKEYDSYEIAEQNGWILENGELEFKLDFYL